MTRAWGCWVEAMRELVQSRYILEKVVRKWSIQTVALGLIGWSELARVAKLFRIACKRFLIRRGKRDKARMLAAWQIMVAN